MTLPIFSRSCTAWPAPIGPLAPKIRKPLRSGLARIWSIGRLVAVLDAVGDAEAVADLLHLRIFRLLQRDRGVGPDIVQRDRQAADIDDVFALAADRLGESFQMRFAERLVLDELDVPVGILLPRLLVDDDLDAGVLSALEHRLQRRAVIRDDADDVDLLGDQVFDRAHLLGRVVRRSARSSWR